MVRRRGMLGRLVFGWFLALLLFGHAKPVFALPGCETVTERPLDELLVPLGDGGRLQLPPMAVKLLPGESVCLTGTLDPSGDLQNLEVVTNAEGRQGPLVELRMQRGENTVLVVRHWGAGKRWLYYDALVLVTEQDIAMPTRTMPVAPSLLGGESWDHGVRKLLLFGFRLGDVPALREKPYRSKRRDSSVFNASVTFGFWGGERSVKLDDLNRGLGRDGYYPLQRNAIMGGLDLDFTFGRVRGGVALGAGGRTTHQRGTDNELSTWMSEVFFTTGFDVLRFEQLHVFLGTGIGGAQLFVDRPQNSTLFPGVQPWEGDGVVFSALEMPFELGVDYFVPLGQVSFTEKLILQFGARVGYNQQLGSGSWDTDVDKKSRELPGPSVDLSGPRGRLVLGIGAQNGWH